MRYVHKDRSEDASECRFKGIEFASEYRLKEMGLLMYRGLVCH